jgi:hypothetical protein
VPGPAVLVPDLTRGVPAWAMDQPHRKIGHARSVRAIADIHGCPCAAGTPTISTSGHQPLSARDLIAVQQRLGPAKPDTTAVWARRPEVCAVAR